MEHLVTNLEAKPTGSTEKVTSVSHVEDASRELPLAPTLSEEEERKLWRKIDMRLMPILCAMYLFSFLDRSNIGNARIQGLETELHLVRNQYNIALTMYSIPYCIFECPSNLLLKRIKPSRWLPGLTVTWGVVMTLMGLVKTYPQLVGVRILLGLAEAGLFPGVVYFLTLWYPRNMLQYRIGLFFGSASIAGAFSGLLAFGISFMDGVAGMLGWSWIFILEGLGTVLVGLVAFIVMVDFPATATFLTREERAYVLHRKKYDNSSVGEDEDFSIDHVKAAFLDWQIWMHILVYFSIVASLNGITLFLPTIINSFGNPPAISQLLTVPPYIVATMVLFAFAHYSDKLCLRSPFILAGLTLCLIGFTINISNAPFSVKYMGTFFVVAGSYAAFPGGVAWLGNNLSGHYKRGVGMALQIGIGNFSIAMAANMYRSQDSPRFVVGHAVELMFVGIGFFAVAAIVVAYRRINARRDWEAQISLEGSDKARYTVDELHRLGDRAPEFRYTL